jgi:hypothetical protein
MKINIIPRYVEVSIVYIVYSPYFCKEYGKYENHEDALAVICRLDHNLDVDLESSVPAIKFRNKLWAPNWLSELKFLFLAMRSIPRTLVRINSKN